MIWKPVTGEEIEKYKFFRKGYIRLNQDVQNIKEIEILDSFYKEGLLYEALGSHKGEIRILDINSYEIFEKVRKYLDILIVIVNPLPSILLKEEGRLREIQGQNSKNNSNNIRYIINYYYENMPKKQIIKFLGAKPKEIIYFYEQDRKDILNAEFSKEMLWDNEEIRKELVFEFSKIRERKNIFE